MGPDLLLKLGFLSHDWECILVLVGNNLMLSLIWLLFVSLSSFFLLSHCPSPPLTSPSPMGRCVWQIGHEGSHFLHLFSGDCMFGTVIILAVTGMSAVMEFPMTKGIGWENVIFHTGVFLDLDRSNPIIFCFAGAGLFSLLGYIGHDLVTNKFIEAGEVDGHGVVALVELDIIGRVVDAVVGIRVADILGSTRGFLTTLTLYCLLFVC